MSTITKLITGRAVITVAIIAILDVLKHYGISVPPDSASIVNGAFDLLVALTAGGLVGAAHHAEAPDASK